MSLATPELLNAIADLSSIREMKVAVNLSAQCGLIVGAITAVGGILGGPPGIALGNCTEISSLFIYFIKLLLLAGGLLGTGLASYHAGGKFKSVPEILAQEATPEQKEKLATALRNLLNAQNIFTVLELAATMQNNRLLMEAVSKVIREFFMSDMGYCIL
ncbi:protein C19orf12 homolog isoform X1 [Copidosoma floridanum]|uniref:protein C19orf12 homolog isoform X1 n=1 Tax=Copidosoma floridanum TaxID=29053 RepID=UPI000C6FAC38|nr:protein C19orf12 homolog isoform X1 [Copidosoma floridanum]XP_023246826.1 protein C19orf12 homolog isoform X1 [Copidosoma floridanum]